MIKNYIEEVKRLTIKNNKIRLIIIDDNEDDCDLLKEFFSNCDDIELCSVELNSIEGVRKVKKYNPDVVLTDFVMPNIDGSEVIKSIKMTSDENPKVIVLSGVNDIKIINEAFECGADYYLMKPVSLLFLKEKIISIFNKDRKNNFKDRSVNACIRDIGVPIRLSGYDYAVEAVNMMLESDRGMMLKEINGVIAQKNYTSIQCVDACLHNAILKAHELHNSKYESLFGEVKRCPSNYIFLRTVREYIRNNRSIN